MGDGWNILLIFLLVLFLSFGFLIWLIDLLK